MSFAARAISMFQGVVSPLIGGTVDNGTSSVTLTFLPDGTVSGSGGLSQNWFLPTTSGIGGSYYLKKVLQTGNLLSGGDFDSPPGEGWNSLATNNVWGYATAPKSGTWSVQIATDAAGTNIVSSGTYTITTH